MSRMERSAEMVGLVSRKKDPKTKGLPEAMRTEVIIIILKENWF